MKNAATTQDRIGFIDAGHFFRDNTIKHNICHSDLTSFIVSEGKNRLGGASAYSATPRPGLGYASTNLALLANKARFYRLDK